MASIVDLIVIAVGVIVVVAGLRRGAVVTVAAFVGIVAGVTAGILLAPFVVTVFASFGAESPVARTVVAALTLFLCMGLLYSAATTLGIMLRRRVRAPLTKWVDAVGGGASAVVAWAVVVWLIAGFMTASGFVEAAHMARSSQVATTLNRISPISSNAALSALDDVLGRAGLPRVFVGTEPVQPIDAPDSTISATVRDAADSVVLVQAGAPRCDLNAVGSGWVIADGVVVTNAHVVAGASALEVVTEGHESHEATLSFFDPENDLAVLTADDLDVPPLELGERLVRGDLAYVAGHPHGGPLTIEPARVRSVVEAMGTDIYDDQSVVREVYSVRGIVREGDSGGPLLDGSGQVVGVVFARSSTDRDTGYALTMESKSDLLDQVSDGPVSSGRCASD